MKIKYFFTIIFIFSLLLSACGFKPIYKETYERISIDYHPILISENSMIITQMFNNFFSNEDRNSNLKLEVIISEKKIPVITNSDGTVSKYKVEVYITFNLIDKTSEKSLYSDFTRGSAQYNVQVNEYDTELKFEESQKTATSNALQLIPIKIENFQSQ